MKSSLIILAGLTAGGLAMPSAPSHIVHEKRDVLPEFVTREAADADATIPVRIALKQSNLDRGMEYILDVSDPDSPNYGKHYSAQQVADLFAPNNETVESVKAWLVKSGIPADKISLSKSKGWLNFDTTVGKLGSLLKTDYHVYNSVNARGEGHLATDEYSLPHEVSPYVDFVLPGLSLGKINKRANGGKNSQVAIKEPLREVPQAFKTNISAHTVGTKFCDVVITPTCIKALYNITDAQLSNLTNPLGVFESLDDVYAQEDLDAFYKLAAPGIPQGTGPDLFLINGATAPNDPEDAGGESDLDFEIAIPIIYPQKTNLYQVRSDYDIFLAFLDAVDKPFCKSDTDRDPNEFCGELDAPNVVSISYGGPEYGESVTLLKRQCDEFMKLGLQGISIVVASGDSGVANDGGNCLGPHHNIFVPDNASGCPYVTSVGSTTLPEGSKIGDPETATTRFSSGGGFSNVFNTPPWQAKAVGKYLLRHNPGYYAYNTTDGVIPTDGGIYNRNGRAYPDIAASGDNGLVVFGGEVHLSGGTSMAAPIIAAIFNRINEERLNVGKGPIGFANTALYKAYDNGFEFFNDITTGDQRLGGQYSARYPSACGNNGFSAVEGWDPVTGLGTPKYDKLVKYFVRL